VDTGNIRMFERIIQKVNSIHGLRKLHHEFKNQRRTVLSNQATEDLQEDYVLVCLSYHEQITELREANLNHVLEKLKLTLNHY
jgi:hypothetical protein